jgi:predicted dehydrogenase
MKNIYLLGILLLTLSMTNKTDAPSEADKKPLKIGVVGLTHTHVHWILGRAKDGDFEITGIAEPNKELAMRYIKQHKLEESLWYPTMEKMIEATKPEAVCAFGNIYDHLKVTEYCAPKGIHVMVEKPLAVSWDHAKRMKSLAKKFNIHLLTNYETTWYASHHKAYEMLSEQEEMGQIRKIVVHDGHPGPVEIGCNDEFLEWLTNPRLNGGGAITDFGCYGADLGTWFMKGEEPNSVFAVTQQLKPDIYPLVDDEATIIVTYENAQLIIQASWNWPYNRKDIELYTEKGYIFADKRNQVKFTNEWDGEIMEEEIEPLEEPYNDPFRYFAGVINKEIQAPNDLSSLSTNMTVMKILEAAKISAKTGEKVMLEEIE